MYLGINFIQPTAHQTVVTVIPSFGNVRTKSEYLQVYTCTSAAHLLIKTDRSVLFEDAVHCQDNTILSTVDE
jgi:hypothetical protein